MKKIGILGSCVTRDGYEYCKDKFSLQYYIARTSLASMFAKRVLNVPTAKFNGDGTKNFTSRMVDYDVNKKSRHIIATKPCDLIVFDGIDDRFDLMKCGATYVTRSSDFLKTNFGRETTKGQRFDVFNEMRWARWCEGVKDLLTIIGDTPVVVHRALWANRSVDEKSGKELFYEGFDKVRLETNNVVLNNMYDYMLRKIPNSIELKISEDFLFSDPVHKWGINYYHYGEEYYKEFSSKLESISRTL